MQLTEERLDKKRSFFRDFIWYTLLFAAIAAGVYLQFLYFGRTLLINTTGNIDGWAQHYPNYVEVKQIMTDLLHGQGFSFWTWDIGLGEDVWMLLKARFLDPLTYIVTAFSLEQMDIGYTIMVIVRQYLAGLSFVVFARGVRFSGEQTVLGGLGYAFSGWAMQATLTQGTFTTALILFPLLVLGVDKMLRDRSPWLFSVSVALLLIYSTIWAYVSAIVIFVYFLLRFFYYHKFTIKGFLCSFASFIVFGLLGTMLSAFSSIQTFIKTSGSNTESTVAYSAWYTMKEYLQMPAELFTLNPVHTSYSNVFVGCVLIVFLPIAILNIRKKSTAAIMMTACLVAGLFPVTGSVLNGFSYTSGRWYFVAAFFMVWALTECVSRETFEKKRNVVIMLCFLAAVFAWSIIICYRYLQIISTETAICTMIGCSFGLLAIAVFAIRAKIGTQKGWRFVCTGFLVVLMAGSIVGTVNISLAPGFGEEITGYQELGRTYSNYQDTCQRVARDVQAEDPSFFRSERIAETKVPANKNMFHDMRSIYMYFSTMKKSWHEYNKVMGNNCGYFDRTTSFSNGNRVGLDTLMGVKYYFIDGDTSSRDERKYVPFGYVKDQSLDGVEIYRNKYSIGMGATYDGYITESELMKYPYLEREQAVMQAAVVPDDCANQIDGVKHLKPGDIKTKVNEVDYEITGTEEIELNDHGFTCKSFEGEITISAEQVKNSELIIAFDNLVREKCTYDDYWELKGGAPEYANEYAKEIARQAFKDNEKFKVKVKKSGVKKIVSNRKSKNQGFDDVTNFYANLGYFEEADGEIVIQIDNVGRYTYDALHVYAVPMGLYEKTAKKLSQNSLNIETFDHDRITGTVDAKEDSILYMSILNDQAWTVKMDGKKVERINDVNISFTGWQVPEGSHSIEMRYASPGLQTGLYISAAGLAILLLLAAGSIILRVRRKRKEQAADQSDETGDSAASAEAEETAEEAGETEETAVH